MLPLSRRQLLQSSIAAVGLASLSGMVKAEPLYDTDWGRRYRKRLDDLSEKLGWALHKNPVPRFVEESPPVRCTLRAVHHWPNIDSDDKIIKDFVDYYWSLAQTDYMIFGPPHGNIFMLPAGRVIVGDFYIWHKSCQSRYQNWEGNSFWFKMILDRTYGLYTIFSVAQVNYDSVCKH